MTRAGAAVATHLAQHHDRCECEPETLGTPWKAQLCRVLYARDDAEMRQQLEEFLDDEIRDVRRLLARVKRVAHLRWDEEDVALSYFGEALLRMVSQRWQSKDGPGTSAVFNYTSNLPMILEAETRSCIREDRRRGLLDGTGGVPGGSAHDRKAGHIATSRQLFEVEHARPPAAEELVAFHNDRMRATRKDAARQGVLMTREDLHEVGPVPLDDASPEIEARLGVGAPPDVGPLNWSDRICAVIARCERLDRERECARARRLQRDPVYLADVARAYFAHHAIGEFPTRGELVERLGIREPAARRELTGRLREVLAVARDLFADYRHAR